MNLLEVEKVTRRYYRGGWFSRREEVKALTGISLAVKEGGSVGVIGRSGAGKSTLGRLILGLERPNEGIIRYRGKDLRQFSRQEWREFRGEVQVVFQNALGSVNPRWQVLDIIAEPIRNSKRWPKKDVVPRVLSLMDMVGLDPLDMDKYPHQFSGGQLQRICIARALSVQPRLIVLDEAVSSLDMLIQAQILKLLRDLQQETGVSYLFISHDIRIVAGFCDEVAIMDRGRISSKVNDLSLAEKSSDPVLRQLANSILPAWPRLAN
ncbi:ABC transporter ATP-binding protein [Desulforhopalus sp. 52FAK]